MHTAARWQFSLRALLLIVAVCAVLSAAWRMLSTSVFLGAVSFVFGSLVPCFLLTGPWRRAYLLAYSAVYGPFVVMATYTYLFVACLHCKAATWTMLPYGPGIISAGIVQRLLGLSPLWGTLGFAIALLVSAVMVCASTWCAKVLGRGWRVVFLAVVVAFCSYCAFVLLALIRA